MPLLQELVRVLANLALQRAEFMWRNAADGRDAAVA
jgi:hypothetical protein